MKLIIVEGLDNVGKDLLIKHLSDTEKNVMVRHWSYPQGNSNDEKTQYQKDSFHNEMKKWQLGNSNNFDETLIWNRSHIGEYVYGTIYRQSHPETWIPQLEHEYLTCDNVYLIFLYADADFLIDEDDGKSYSVNKKDKELEIQKFHESIDKSIIKNKIKIKVNDGKYYINESNIHEQINSKFSFI